LGTSLDFETLDFVLFVDLEGVGLGGKDSDNYFSVLNGGN
jgi:hypothetical protein